MGNDGTLLKAPVITTENLVWAVWHQCRSQSIIKKFLEWDVKKLCKHADSLRQEVRIIILEKLEEDLDHLFHEIWTSGLGMFRRPHLGGLHNYTWGPGITPWHRLLYS